jgi:hypothetical protein
MLQKAPPYSAILHMTQCLRANVRGDLRTDSAKEGGWDAWSAEMSLAPKRTIITTSGANGVNAPNYTSVCCNVLHHVGCSCWFSNQA